MALRHHISGTKGLGSASHPKLGSDDLQIFASRRVYIVTKFESVNNFCSLIARKNDE